MIANSRLLFLGIALSACALLSACVRPPGPEPRTLRINLATEPPSLDWHVSTDFTSFDVVSNIMIGLTQYRPDLSCAPACASSWDILDGGQRYVFHLRPDVKWSDGKKLVAGDFEYAWRRILDPKTAAPYAYFLFDVDGAKEFNEGKLKDPAKVGFKAIDDHTFEVRLNKAAAYFINLTAISPSYPQRRDVIEKHGDRWTEAGNMITNGPFVLKEWKHEYKIELEANPLFFEGRPKIDKLKMFMIPEQATAFALYENSQLDYIDNRSFPTPEVAQNRNSPQYKNFPLLRNNYIGFNAKKAPMTDPRVRLAISKSIDRTVFSKLLRRGEKPSFTWVPDGLAGYSPASGPTYDPAEGRRLLKEAGYDSGNFPTLKVLYPTREDVRLIMESLQDQLKRNLGIKIELVNMEFKVYMETLRRDAPPMFRASWGADYPDPETFANIFCSWNTNNYTNWTSPRYDDLVGRAAGEQDTKLRASLYQQADQMLCKEQGAIAPIFLATQNIMVKPWVKGIAVNALDLQFFKDVSIEENY